MEYLMEVFQLVINMPHNFSTLPLKVDNLFTSFPWSLILFDLTQTLLELIV